MGGAFLPKIRVEESPLPSFRFGNCVNVGLKLKLDVEHFPPFLRLDSFFVVLELFPPFDSMSW